MARASSADGTKTDAPTKTRKVAKVKAKATEEAATAAKPKAKPKAAEGAAKKAAAKKTTKAASSKAATAKPAKAPKATKAPKAKEADAAVEAPEDGEEAGTEGASARGKQLVIVESPAKAKTINKYLGSNFVVQASVGHIRDLPTKSEKGAKQPVPGVDLEHGFRPTYVVLTNKSKTVADLKRLAKSASQVWFATDLDREGEAIAWHLAEELKIPPQAARRVVFNAITQQAVHRAFANPRPIDVNKVNAQQARRILDRIVGYQASPLLWKKVARGLSAGRVQSVAVKLIVEREREIAAFVPDERWEVTVRLCVDPGQAGPLTNAWAQFLATVDEKGKGPTLKAQNTWMSQHASIESELVELGGEKFALTAASTAPRDLSADVTRVVEAVGLHDIKVTARDNPEGKGPQKTLRTVTGAVDPAVRYRVKSVETKRTTSRPLAPFITSSLQIAAANQLGFTTQRTMRAAQQLYEGIAIPNEGQVGLITYMRTDATALSAEAITQLRGFIGSRYGEPYLPEKPNIYTSSNKDAQEAHEAIRPTDINRRPEDLREALTDEQFKLYSLIWARTVACQMTPAQWDATAVMFERSDKPTGAVVRATGRTLVFDGFLKVLGVQATDEQTLPSLGEGQGLGAFSIEPAQKFTSPPPRYTEASLVKTLEAEGIGRPSTYASIISVIQERKYVEQLDRRFYATDLGEVVTDKLVEAFKDLMDVGYTRAMEAQLDEIEDKGADWQKMLERFYGGFRRSLDIASDTMTHAKAEAQPAIYKCPKCGSPTCYRFGKNGRFLSCTTYPECDYAAPITRDGRPLLPERVDMVCPEDGSDMELRNSRFGPFLASVNFPHTKFVINLDKKEGVKLPTPPALEVDVPCPKCGAPLNLRMGKRGPWLGCSKFPKCRGRLAWTSLEDDKQATLGKQLAAHEKAHPPVVLKRRDGRVIAEGTPVAELLIPGGLAELEIHPDALANKAAAEAGAATPPPPAAAPEKAPALRN
ncbi:DNA topoisomerase [Nannocystis pusilla]|nr:DNA topoisomerase [Nannocystis pusilla]